MNIAQPNRVSRSYTQRLVGAPSAVFPLLCLLAEATSAADAVSPAPTFTGG